MDIAKPAKVANNGANPKRIRGAPPGGRGNYHKTPRPWSKRTIPYTAAHAVQARKLLRLGLTNGAAADLMGLSASTFNRWIAENEEFKTAVAQGRTLADAEVADKLYQRATGYSHTAQKVIANYKTGEHSIAEFTENYAPDTIAGIFWLKNRQPELWKDRQEHTGANGGPIEFAAVLSAAIAREAKALEAPTIDGESVDISPRDG